jgi:hypothetical protein
LSNNQGIGDVGRTEKIYHAKEQGNAGMLEFDLGCIFYWIVGRIHL